MASTHYADATQQLLKDEGIWYIPKYNKPSAVASLCPIEDFWAAVKKENYNSEWEVEHFAQLKQRILPDQTQKCVEKGYLAVHKWALLKKVASNKKNIRYQWNFFSWTNKFMNLNSKKNDNLCQKN